MNLFPLENGQYQLLGWYASSGSIKQVEDILKRKSKNISDITLVPEEEIISGNYTARYIKKMSELCAVLLGHLEENKREYERLVEVFKAHNIGYFFYNGGNDSADTAYKVSQISKTLDYPIKCIAIPKTVDNDLAITDCCPGFGSAAKYIATSTMEASLDVESMSETSTKVFILEVMGRNAGWMAASSALAKNSSTDAPHIILLPEVTFNQQKFIFHKTL